MSDWVDKTLNKKNRDDAYDSALEMVRSFKENGYKRNESEAIYDSATKSLPYEHEVIIGALFKIWKKDIFDEVYKDE